MADLNEICAGVVSEVSDAVGCAVVDLETGLLLAVSHNVPTFTQSYLDAVAAAAVEMFRGKNVSSVEKLLSKSRGAEVKNMIQEIQMTTTGTYHFMKIVDDKPNALAVLITKKSSNLGSGWMALRAAAGDMGPLIP